MRTYDVNKFIFSSKAAIFGWPHYTPIEELHPQQPVNPYGRIKLMVEQALSDYEPAFGFQLGCRHDFIAAGADPECQLGEPQESETFLIPISLQAASGRCPHITVFSRDCDTPDSTCIRDYIHINDLCSGHWPTLQSLKKGHDSERRNVGNGNEFSVQGVIDTAERNIGRKISVQNGLRRAGDLVRLVADAAQAQQQLGWQSQFADLATIIQHAGLGNRKPHKGLALMRFLKSKLSE
jgi:UDP-glucose 4-epimerase